MSKITFIAEIGINHNGDLNLLHELVRQAAMAGADYAKVQLYEPKELFGNIDESHLIAEAERCKLSYSDFVNFTEWCWRYGIQPMASVFTHERLEWLENSAAGPFGAIKIASRTARRDPDLVRELYSRFERVFISTGMTLHESLSWSDLERTEILACVSEYPSDPGDYKAFTYGTAGYAGLSCHCIGHENALRAIALGARVVERHFTLNKTMPGSDHVLSSTPDEFAEMVRIGRGIAAL